MENITNNYLAECQEKLPDDELFVDYKIIPHWKKWEQHLLGLICSEAKE